MLTTFCDIKFVDLGNESNQRILHLAFESSSRIKDPLCDKHCFKLWEIDPYFQKRIGYKQENEWTG